MDEKVGGNERPAWQINQFRDAVDDFLLDGLEIEGPTMCPTNHDVCAYGYIFGCFQWKTMW